MPIFAIFAICGIGEKRGNPKKNYFEYKKYIIKKIPYSA